MGFIETSYGSKPNLSDVNIDSNLNMGSYEIISSGGINLENSDLINVDKLMCNDFFSAILTTGSATVQDTLILDDVSGDGSRTKKIRIPSNIVSGSQVRLTVMANAGGSSGTVYLDKYDPNTETYTQISSQSVSGSSTVKKTFTSISINAGELYAFRCSGSTVSIKGSSGIEVLYDYEVISGAVWEVIE